MRRLMTAVAILASMGAIPPQQITWTQSMIDPPTAQTFIYTLTINEEGNPTPKPVGLLNILCGGTAPNSECSTVLPVAANSAIITGNTSTLTAKDPSTNLTSAPSLAFKGDQGCIYRDNLYKVSQNAQQMTNKQGLNAVLAEFKKAKFKHVNTQDLKGNAFLVTEQCVGYIVP